MDEETEINNNDLNNNTDFEEEVLPADPMEMADMNPNEIMETLQNTLLKEAKLVRQRIGYKVTVDQIYHFLEVAVDNEDRVQLVVEDLQERINRGEFTQETEETTPEVAEVSNDSPVMELNDSLTFVAESESDEPEEMEEARVRPSKRKVEIQEQQLQNAINDMMEDENLRQNEATMNEKVENDLRQLPLLFPDRDMEEMSEMYLTMHHIEKENTLNVLAQQIYDAEENAVAPIAPKRPRLELHVDEAGPSNDHTQKLDQMCDILMGMGMTRDDLKRKGEELNWDQDSITFFIATQLQNDDAPVAGPSNQDTPNPSSPQPGPSHEVDVDEEVLEEPGDDSQVSSQLADIMGVLPDADPEYLRHNVVANLNNAEGLAQFVDRALVDKNYPKREDYEKRKERENILQTFTGRMSVPEFLKHFPNPREHFESKTDGNKDLLYQQHCLAFLKGRFPKIHVKTITDIFKKTYNLTKAVASLEKEKPKRHSRRSAYEIKLPLDQHMHFLQEATYLNKKEDIENHFKSIEDARAAAFQSAKDRNELVACQVCCDDECLFEDMTTCAEGHLFCKNCVRQYAETRIGDSLDHFPCLEAGCTSEFTLPILKSLLEAKVFACLARRLQTEEIRAAMIPDLETCPFCPFSYIPDDNSLVFECQEDSCKKVSCRKCKEPNHLPLKCEEVEKDEEIQARRAIEERMTEALVRECPKCKNKFVKNDGCNKMTCSCGTKSCYICRSIITDYNHFDQTPHHHRTLVPNPNGRCPLYSHNDELHVQNVIAAGEKAKEELTKKGVNLKHDPTKVVPEATRGAQMNILNPAYLDQLQGLDLGNPVNMFFDPLNLAQQRLMQQQRQLDRMQNQIAARRQQRAYYEDPARYGNEMLTFQERYEQYRRRAQMQPRALRVNQQPRPGGWLYGWQPFQLQRALPAAADQPGQAPPVAQNYRQFRLVRNNQPAANPAANPQPPQQARQPVIYRIPVPGPSAANMQNLNQPDALRSLNQRLQNLLQTRGNEYLQVRNNNNEANQRVAEFILQHMPEGGGAEGGEQPPVLAVQQNPPPPPPPAQQNRPAVAQQQTATQRVAEFILQHLPNNEAPAPRNPPPAPPQIPAPPPPNRPNVIQMPVAVQQPAANRNREESAAEKKFASLLDYYKGLLMRLIRVRNPTDKELNQYRFLYIGLRKLQSKCKNFPKHQDSLTRLQGVFQKMTSDNAHYKAHKELIKKTLLTKDQSRTVQTREEAGPSRRLNVAGPSRMATRPRNVMRSLIAEADDDDMSDDAAAPDAEAPAADNDGGSNSSPESDDYVNNFKFDD